jgi:hypothetical protein
MGGERARVGNRRATKIPELAAARQGGSVARAPNFRASAGGAGRGTDRERNRAHPGAMGLQLDDDIARAARAKKEARSFRPSRPLSISG